MKTLLCGIAKCENNYILEWVEHHLSIGFDKIVIYDNNDIDGEKITDVLGKYVKSGQVDIIDVRGKVGTVYYLDNIYSIQIESYNDCYNRYGDECDWFFFEDIDEFLELQKHKNVKDFLSQEKFNDYNNIKLCWKYYDDNNLISVEDENYSVKRFTHHVNILQQNAFVKSFVRSKLGVTINSPHGFSPVRLNNEENAKILKPCNAKGRADEVEQILKDIKVIHEAAWVNHYRFKTVGEFMDTKLRRGWPDNYANLVKMDFKLFFAFNKPTQEKVDYVNNRILEMNKAQQKTT